MSVVIYQNGTGSPEALEVADREVPLPTGEDVQISQEAIGLNYLDVLFRRGSFAPPTNPFVNGFEAAGTVTAVGPSVRNLAAGDRVGYFSTAGAYSKDRLISAKDLVRIPHGVTSVQAATFMAKGLTARMAVKQAYEVRAGDVLLITGGAGAIGSIITRWAVALGANVIAIVSSEEKAQAARENGAAEALIGTLDLPEVIAAHTSAGVDAVLDAVGGEGINVLLPFVKNGGRIVSYGNAAGPANPNQTALRARSLSFESPSLAQYLHGADAVQAAVDELFETVHSHVFDSMPVRQLPLTEVQRAHHDMEERKTSGVTVLLP